MLDYLHLKNKITVKKIKFRVMFDYNYSVTITTSILISKQDV